MSSETVVAPRPGLVAAGLAVARATVGPFLRGGAIALVLALVVGLLGGDVLPPLQIGSQAWILLCVSLAAHEAAHLIACRAPQRRRADGELLVGPLTVACRPPSGLSPRHLLACAVVGPVAGAAVSVSGFLLPTLPGLVAVVLVMVHLVNLLPFVADGRMAALALLAMVLRRTEPTSARRRSPADRTV